MTRRGWAIVACGGLVIVVASVAFLFGSRTRRDDYWGDTTIRKRWGVEREILIDRDLNGNADVRITYPGLHRTIATHDRPEVLQIDNDPDGTFEIEWKSGPPPRLRVTSKQGTAVYTGADAQFPSQRLHIRSRHELGLTSGAQPGT
jgi:hypothetical protein